MKQYLVFALAAALLAGCGAQPQGNEAVEADNLLEPVENLVSNTADDATAAPGNEAPQAAGTPGTSAPAAVPPAPPGSTAPPPPAAGKRPSTRPPQPQAEPDPHAGHDMGNMANMQH